MQIYWIIGDAVQNNNQSSLKSARAGRASRAGARAGRIVRLVRMVKLYKYISREQEKTEGDISASREGHSSRSRSMEKKNKSKSKEESGDALDLPPESHVGAAMSDLTTRR